MTRHVSLPARKVISALTTYVYMKHHTSAYRQNFVKIWMQSVFLCLRLALSSFRLIRQKVHLHIPIDRRDNLYCRDESYQVEVRDGKKIRIKLSVPLQFERHYSPLYECSCKYLFACTLFFIRLYFIRISVQAELCDSLRIL